MYVNEAKIPRHVADDAIMMKSQKFNCASGQRYTRRRASIVRAILRRRSRLWEVICRRGEGGGGGERKLLPFLGVFFLGGGALVECLMKACYRGGGGVE